MYATLTSLFLLLPAVAPPPAQTAAAADAPAVTQADLLNRLIDVDRLYSPPAGERTGMFSSGPKPPAFLRTQADGWSVMAELSGPGALTRIWSPNPQGRIRIELDETNSFELNFADLFSGRTPPFETPLCYVADDGGHVCYFPIGFSKGCRILARDCESLYEISYVLFPPGTNVQSFARELDEPALAALDAVITAWDASAAGKRPASDVRTYVLSNRQELRAGEKLTAESFDGGGIIRSLQVSIAGRLPEARYLLHQFILRIYFDNQEQPAVEAPLIDFFGSGLTLTRFCSLLGGTDLWTDIPGEATPENLYRLTQESRFMYCYFPMPFADVARIEIEAPPNVHKARPVSLMLYALIQRDKPPAGALQFHARFRGEDPCEKEDYSVLEARGPGRIVGCVLNAASPQGGWGQAGGPRIWIDGDKAPRYAGACIQALIGRPPDAGRPVREPANPLHGVTAAGRFGKCSGYRWFLSDSIDFERSARFAIDNSEAAPRETSYSTLVYWYADPQAGQPGGRRLFVPLTLDNLTPGPLRIAGAVEVEDHVVGGVDRVLKEQYADGNELSGQLAAIIPDTGPVQINIPSETERVVHLTLRMHQLRERYFDKVEIIDPDGRPLTTIKYDRHSGGLYPVGRVRLKAGDNLFTVICSKRAVLDCWILQDAPDAEADEAVEANEPDQAAKADQAG
ncbi:MAG TPA: DUF2961 domain-containing protein [Phycisphaerae bacterium]|jgi:hypothetical protein|nr:DUF2961 domain-containing protein [Phycisphaerae bacterium]HPC21648.1 DUF2961 domain-containing protein [Phycisphaerae bacterium]